MVLPIGMGYESHSAVMRSISDSHGQFTEVRYGLSGCLPIFYLGQYLFVDYGHADVPFSEKLVDHPNSRAICPQIQMEKLI